MWIEALQNSVFLAPVVAFFAGVATFFASCLLPLVPIYFAYLTGLGLALPNTFEKTTSRAWWNFLWNWRKADKNIPLSVLCATFVLGFVSTFVVLGALVNRFALIWAPYKNSLRVLAGAFFIFVGLFVLGLFQKSFLQREWRFPLQQHFTRFRRLNAFLTGVVFALGWTPCIGPSLALILFWAGRADTFWKGIVLLLSFGIGLGVPFLLLGFVYERVAPSLFSRPRISRAARVLSGIVIVLSGVLLINNQWQRLALGFIHFFGLQSLTM